MIGKNMLSSPVSSRLALHKGWIPSRHTTVASKTFQIHRFGVGSKRGFSMSAAFDPQIFLSTLALGGIAFTVLDSKPQGFLNNPRALGVRKSTLKGAGLGVFLLEPCQKGTILGCYPGRVWADHSWLTFKGNPEVQLKARRYIWRMDDGNVIDPTNSEGNLEEMVPWMLPFGLRVPYEGVATVLARINEPGILGDVNVRTEERDSRLLFVLEREVSAGEELFLDYGPYYDRTGYNSGGLNTYVDS
jgi:hypothetical protein